MFLMAVKDRIPVRKIRDINSPPWIDGERRHLIRKKCSAEVLTKQITGAQVKTVFSEPRSQVPYSN